MSNEAMKLALESLEDGEAGHAAQIIREALAEQPAQQVVDSNEKAGAYMDARLWEFIDMAAAWPEAKPDPRTWSHVMVYASKPAQQEPVAWMDRDGDLYATEPDKNWCPPHYPLYTRPQAREPLSYEELGKLVSATPWRQDESMHTYAVRACRAIEAAHGIKE